MILQEILDVIAENGNSQIGFENALTFAGIEYVPNYLHYAKYDANYLYQLLYQAAALAAWYNALKMYLVYLVE